MAGPAGKPGTKRKPAKADLVGFRAGERASTAKGPQKRTAGPATKKIKNTPKGNGATVGSAAKAITDAAWGVNRGIQGALKSSPGLKAPQIKGVMSLKPKRK